MKTSLELPDDDGDDADVAVASIFYGEGNVDVQLNLGELRARTSVHTEGMKYILDIGRRRYTSIFKASEFTSVMPQHKSLGSTNYNALVNDVKRTEPLMHHFEYFEPWRGSSNACRCHSY